jgi:hypothetical protein
VSEAEVLARLTGASPGRLLEELSRIGATLAKHDRPRPEIELFLASGQGVKGRVVAVSEGTAIVHVAGNPRTPAVTFVRVDHIAAITVADASLLVTELRIEAPVPSKLELQRQAAARGDGLATTLGRPFAVRLGGASELDDDGRRAIGLALPLAVDVVTAIAGDELGREALAPIGELELGAARSAEVRREAGRLIIRAPTLLSEQYTSATLRKAVEQLL